MQTLPQYPYGLGIVDGEPITPGEFVGVLAQQLGESGYGARAVVTLDETGQLVWTITEGWFSGLSEAS